MVKGLTQLSAAKASWDSVYSRCCRNPSTLPPDGEGIDGAVGSQGPAGTRSQLLALQGEVQRSPRRQHDHPEHQSSGSTRQGCQHVLDAHQVGRGGYKRGVGGSQGTSY